MSEQCVRERVVVADSGPTANSVLTSVKFSQMLAMLEEALFRLMTSDKDEQDWRHFQVSLLKCDCLGCQRYGREAFLHAANSRFAYPFDYVAHLLDPIQRLGWDGYEDAVRFAQIQMLDAPCGPDITEPVLEATGLEEFADAFWNPEPSGALANCIFAIGTHHNHCDLCTCAGSTGSTGANVYGSAGRGQVSPHRQSMVIVLTN